jgi:hypothetical protein
LRLRQSTLTPERYAVAHAAVMGAAEQLQVSQGRFDAYSDASWIRLACSSLPARSTLATNVLEERAQRPQPFESSNLTGSQPAGFWS